MKNTYYIFTFVCILFFVGCNKVNDTSNYQKSTVEQIDKEKITDSSLEDNHKPIEIETKIINQNDNAENNKVNEVNSEFTDDILSFIPEGWAIVKTYGGEVVEGYLNNDNISDIAFVIEETETQETAGQRVLMIITGNNDGTYDLALKAEKAIRRSDEGGIMGEPFMGLDINRGSLLVSHYGGSAWRWSTSYRFRFQDDGWYMIGATEDWFNATSNAGRIYEDINLLTGDYIKIETDDNGVEDITNGNRGKKSLVKLQDFDTNDERQF